MSAEITLLAHSVAVAGVSTTHDWLDYLAAFAGVGSLALAGVAAVVAIRSSRGT